MHAITTNRPKLKYLGVLLAAGMLFSLVHASRAQEQPAADIPAEGGGATFRVFGHRQGLVGYTTANGHVIQPNDFFVALPCYCVLSSRGGNEFQVRLEYKGTSIIVPVWDVGPWNVEDNYWDPPSERTWPGCHRVFRRPKLLIRMATTEGWMAGAERSCRQLALTLAMGLSLRWG